MADTSHTHAKAGSGGSETHSHPLEGSGKGHSHEGLLPLPEAVNAAELNAKARNALPSSSFGFVDSDGKGHLPLNDEGHARAALSRFNQTQFPSASVRASAKAKVLAAAKKFGIDVDDATAAKMADRQPPGRTHTHQKAGGGEVEHTHTSVLPGHDHKSEGLLPYQPSDDTTPNPANPTPPAIMSEPTGLFAVDSGSMMSLAEGKPIPFLTTGEWQFDEYGDFRVTRDDLQTIKANFDADVRRQELSVINEHHDKTRAVGWIKDLHFDGDDRLMATPEWTAEGERLVAEGAYKYTSPEAKYRTLLLRNWSDPEFHEVLHPIVASGLALTNFPKIKALGKIAATETNPACELLAFSEHPDGRNPAAVADIMLFDAAEPDAIPAPPPIDTPSPILTFNVKEPGTFSLYLSGVGNSLPSSPLIVNGAESPTNNRGAQPMPDPIPAPETTEPNAPEPVVAATEPAAVTAPAPATVAASEHPSVKATHELLMAEQAKSRALETRVEAAETLAANLAERLAAMDRDKTVNGIRAEFSELLREGRITPAEIKSLLPDDDHAVKLSENRFVLDAYKARPKNSAVNFAEIGQDRGAEGSNDPVSQMDMVAQEIRKANPKLTKEVAFAEALKLHPELYADYAADHNARNRVGAF